jgi:hypothetical protein
MCWFNGGSGFPAAMRTTGAKTIRGWKAAPTIHKLHNLITIELLQYSLIFAIFPVAIFRVPVYGLGLYICR